MENILSIVSEKPWILIGMFVWMVPWKGWALWRAARRGQFGWFVVLLVVNTLAILEILYIFIFSRTKAKSDDIKTDLRPETKNSHNLRKPKLTL